MVSIAINLKAARINAGLTQKEAYTSLGISKSTLSNYENYRTKPDIDTSQRIAKLYGLTVNDIRWKK